MVRVAPFFDSQCIYMYNINTKYKYSSLSRNVLQWHAGTTPEYARVQALLLVPATTRHNQSPTDDGQCDFAAIMAAITTNRAPVRGVGRRASERASGVVLCTKYQAR